MTDSLVSIIIPVYNVEKYLDNCIKSVVNQSYSNLEIILVDDGSTDNSGKKCDEWKDKDKRIKVVHKDNDGLNNARKSGWEICNGKYVTFLDSDDFFHEDNIEKSVGALVLHGAEAAIYAFCEFADSDEKKVVSSLTNVSEDARDLTGKNQIARYALLGELNFSDTHFMTVWGKLYKRELVDRVDWEISNYRAFEDNFWTPQALLSANKIVLIPDKLIFYRRNIQYGAFGDSVLSTRLVGNSWNGQPIGYLEFVDKMDNFYKGLIRQYDIDGIDSGLADIIFINKFGRMESLIRNNLLGEENNLEYVKTIWDEHRRRDEAILSEVSRLNNEISRLMGIKASARRLAGNIKRRVKRS